MAFEEQLPEWEAEGTQPPKTKRMEGWNPAEKPPASWFNWLFHRTYKALQELQQKAAEKVDVQVAQQIAQQAEQTAQQAVQTASQTAGALASHLNDNVRHVTQTEKDNWNNKVSKSGDTMTGQLSFAGHVGHIFIVFRHADAVYKPWAIHKPDSHNLIFAPLQDDGVDWDWSNQISFHPNGDISSGSSGYGNQKFFWHQGNSGPFYRGAGSPEGVVTAPPGSIYQNTNGGQGTTLYYKATGTGNTGWRAVA